MLIVGAAGSMGKRYRAILNSLNVPFKSFDLVEYPRMWENETIIPAVDWFHVKHCQRAIVCTPSRTHSISVDELQELGIKKLLIEKPMFDHETDYQWARKQTADLRMVCNYKFIDGTEGPTMYNYYDAGREEPWMNYFQIIGMARGELQIHDRSPVWQCTMNGRILSLLDVQNSYVTMIRKWIKDPSELVGLEEAYQWFQKAQKWASEYKAGSPLDDFQIKSSMKSGTGAPSSINVYGNA